MTFIFKFDLKKSLGSNKVKFSNSSPNSDPNASSRRPQEVIVFTIGGVTYEESLAVHQVNSTVPGVRVLLGGTSVHNSRSFLDEVLTATQAAHALQARAARS